MKPKEKKLPKHVVVNLTAYIENNAFKKRLDEAEELLFLQTENKIPIITINLMSKNYKPEQLDDLIDYFLKLKRNQHIHKKGIRVSVIGKWYDLPGRVVEQIKSIIDDTKEYDHFFYNLCINYNPHEEIADMTKIIAKKIEVKKLSLENVDTKEVKDNLYSSYFLPADIVIELGKRFSGTLLWDSVGAKVVFLKKKELKKKDFLKAIKDFQKNCVIRLLFPFDRFFRFIFIKPLLSSCVGKPFLAFLTSGI